MYRKTIFSILFIVISYAEPIISFDKNLHNFGNINEEKGLTSCEFIFTNKGDAPLLLKEVESSCGCAVAGWPKEEIAPGDSSVITVTFDPAARPGPFNKTIKIYSNAANNMTVLRIVGEVNGAMSPMVEEQPKVVLVTFVSDPEVKKQIESNPDGSYKLEEISMRRHQITGTAEGYIEIDKRLVLFSDQYLDEDVRAVVMSSGTSGLVTINDAESSSNTAQVFGESAEEGKPKPLQGILISKANPFENSIQSEIIPDGLYKIEQNLLTNYQISGSVIGTLTIIQKIQLVPGRAVKGYIKGQLQRGSLDLKKSGLLIYAEDAQGEIVTVHSASDGRFEFTNLKDGVYIVRVADSQYIFPEEEVEIYSGLGVENVILDASFGQLSGKIIDQETADPVAEAIIILEQTPGIYDLPMPPIRRTVKTDNNGIYLFENMGLGLFQIQVQASGYGTFCESALISRDRMKIKKDMILAPEGTISGRISGLAVFDHMILQVLNQEKKTLILQNILINKDGAFKISGLASGRYALMLSAANKYCIKTNIEVQSRKNKSVDIQFKEGSGVLSGQIKSGGKQLPVESAIVIAESASFSSYTLSQANGSYTLAGLPKGAYTVYTLADKFDGASKKNILVNENETQTGVDFLLTPAL